MRRPIARKVVIEFEGGLTTESSFDALPAPLQFELLRQPFASAPSPDPAHEKFVILEWDDGWKEVIEVDSNCTAVNRYAVISRPEDVGRLSLHREDGYPELIEIARKPLGLKRITFLDAFQLSRDRSVREGKKTDHFYKLTKSGDARAEQVDAFKRAAAAEGIDLHQLQSQDPMQLRTSYEQIRRQMGLKAGERQQDVWDFMAYLAKAAEVEPV